jgi:hypothetical protein
MNKEKVDKDAIFLGFKRIDTYKEGGVFSKLLLLYSNF